MGRSAGEIFSRLDKNQPIKCKSKEEAQEVIKILFEIDRDKKDPIITNKCLSEQNRLKEEFDLYDAWERKVKDIEQVIESDPIYNKISKIPEKFRKHLFYSFVKDSHVLVANENQVRDVTKAKSLNCCLCKGECQTAGVNIAAALSKGFSEKHVESMRYVVTQDNENYLKSMKEMKEMKEIYHNAGGRMKAITSYESDVVMCETCYIDFITGVGKYPVLFM